MGFGLMYYNARWYDPYLNHFTQPDSIVPDPYNSQDYDRYSYVRNNPIRYNDPSGHVCSDPDDPNGGCESGSNFKTKRDVKIHSLKYQITKKHNVKITGGWDQNELSLLKESLDKTAEYLGGADNLNQAIQASLDKMDLDTDYLTFHNLSGTGYCYGQSYNCYSSGTGTITIADGNFTSTYQTSKNRPFELGLRTTEMGAQVSIVHETGHMLKIAIPASLAIYGESVSNPWSISPSNGLEENMVNAIAYYVVSGGGSSFRYQDHLDFAASAASLWNYYP